MIAIDNILVSNEVVQKHCVCDEQKCKGAGVEGVAYIFLYNRRNGKLNLF